MREKIAKIIREEMDAGYDGQLLYVGDAANQILSLISEEIEKELKGREDDFSSQDIDYGEGWRDCKHWILSLLKE